FLVTLDFRSDETELVDRAIRNNVTISALDARGLFVPNFDMSQRTVNGSVQSGITKDMLARQAATEDADVMGTLAYGTGGTFFQNNNDFDEGFRKAAELPDFTYVLGFAPQNLKYDGSFHGLKVSLKAKGYTLEARRGYYAPKHAMDPA